MAWVIRAHQRDVHLSKGLDFDHDADDAIITDAVPDAMKWVASSFTVKATNAAAVMKLTLDVSNGGYTSA